jgi:hypothetical protein
MCPHVEASNHCKVPASMGKLIAAQGIKKPSTGYTVMWRRRHSLATVRVTCSAGGSHVTLNSKNVTFIHVPFQYRYTKGPREAVVSLRSSSVNSFRTLPCVKVCCGESSKRLAGERRSGDDLRGIGRGLAEGMPQLQGLIKARNWSDSVASFRADVRTGDPGMRT